MAVMEDVLERPNAWGVSSVSEPFGSGKAKVVYASDESVRSASSWAIAKNKDAYLELARYDSN